ncbi:hypothetical protein L2E82_37260 [Cichorium intybus]|uniref:Uncharacterized protein n=1 Tax=Cichorium intybus TaxID=13427 RepID=A0ACB9AEX6_CICIN|nr:hypothetical protein L2E82_37260 [Cichorium intybus]
MLMNAVAAISRKIGIHLFNHPSPTASPSSSSLPLLNFTRTPISTNPKKSIPILTNSPKSHTHFTKSRTNHTRLKNDMKFGKSLSNQIEQTLPEWRDKFLSYKELKKRLKLINPQQKSGDVCNRAAKRPRVLLRQCCRRLNEKEIEKFNLFFVEKEEEYIIKLKFNEKLLVKQENENLQILDVLNSDLTEVSRREFMTPSTFIFLYENQLFLTFRNRTVAVWNFRGELVTSFEDHLLWHPDCNTNNIYITSDQDLIISYYKTEAEDPLTEGNAGSINISNILTGKCLAKVKAKNSAPLDECCCSGINVDTNGKGTLHYGEFVAISLHLRKMANDEHLHKGFSYFDKDGNGFIDPNELQHILKEDGDGKISYEEFVAMMKTGMDWRKASRHYSRGRFNSLSVKLMKDGSINLGSTEHFTFLNAYLTVGKRLLAKKKQSPQQVFGNIMNRDTPWPKILEEMSFEAYDVINK